MPTTDFSVLNNATQVTVGTAQPKLYFWPPLVEVSDDLTKIICTFKNPPPLQPSQYAVLLTDLRISGAGSAPISVAAALTSLSSVFPRGNSSSAGSGAGSGIVNYYVDGVNGDDTNSGLLSTLPYKTLSKAVSVCPDGGNILIKGNSKLREEVSIGTRTIGRYGIGSRPVVDASDIVTSFANYSGIVYTFTVTLPAGAITRCYAGVWENDVRLTEYITSDGGNLAGVVALLQANPGSFYMATGSNAAGWTAGTHTFYISASDSGNPQSNGKVYESIKRQYAITHAGSNITGITFQKMYHHDGLSRSDTGATMPFALYKDVVVREFGRHGLIDPVSNYEDCIAIGFNPKFPGGGIHPYAATVYTHIPHFKRCNAIGNFIQGNGFTGFFSHGAIAGTAKTHERFIYEDCKCSGLSTGFGNADADYIDLIRCTTEWCDNDELMTPFVAATLTDCNFKGASQTTITLPKTGTTKTLNRVRSAAAITQTSQMLIYGSGASGTINFYNSEIVNQGGYSVTPSLSLIASVGAIDKIKVRNTIKGSFGGNIQYFVKAPSVTTWDIPDGELLMGGLIGSGTAYDPLPKNYLNSVATNLSAATGVGEVLNLPLRKLYRGYPLEDGFGKNPGSPFPVTTGYNAVCYAASGNQQPRATVFVGKKIATNPYGNNQSYVVFTPTNELLSVFFIITTAGSAGAYIAVGKGGYIVRSTDGVAWTQITSGTTNDLYGGAVTGAAGTAVIVGSSGTILRSTDNGLTWAAATTPPASFTSNLKGVAYGLSLTLFMAIGDGGVCITSPDGNTWTSQSSGTTADLKFITFGTGNFVFGGTSGTLKRAVGATSFGSVNSGSLKDIIAGTYGTGTSSLYGGSKFIILCGVSGLQTGEMLTSTDAINWTPIQADMPFQPTGIAFEGYLDRGWVISGKNNAGGSSNDGINWNFRNSLLPDLTKLKANQSGSEAYLAQIR